MPITCNVVLTVSIGIMKILQTPAVIEAAPVFKAIGNSVLDSNSAKMPTFAAVSPNLEMGPWSSAGP